MGVQMITDTELERLLEAASPYPREPREGLSVRAQSDLQRLMDEDSVAPRRRTHVRRLRLLASSAIAIVAVAVVVIGVPTIASLIHGTPPLTTGVPAPTATSADPVLPAPDEPVEAFGTFVSADGSTKGRVDVTVNADSIHVNVVYLVTTHDELAASGSLTSRENRLCLDDGTDVEFGSFRTGDHEYAWELDRNMLASDWTALQEVDLAVSTAGSTTASCASTIIARAVLDWSGTTTDPRSAEYATAIADWPEPLPPGYSWPAWSDLPHTEPFGAGDFHEADNADGVYRCILIDAAWHAYFEDNDPATSKDYATRADKYAIPGNEATPTITDHGRIVDEELARANGLCQGISGDASP